MNQVLAFISDNILYLLLAVLLLNMLQRRYQEHARAKRFATLYIAILILALMVGTVLIIYLELPEFLLLPLLALLVFVGYRYRAKVFPFRLNCSQCGQRLSGKRILFYDSNTCETCADRSAGD